MPEEVREQALLCEAVECVINGDRASSKAVLVALLGSSWSHGEEPCVIQHGAGAGSSEH